MDFSLLLSAEKAVIDAALEQRLPPADQRPEALHQAMRHGVLNGGKRLRPILCRAAARAVGGDADAALVPGLALEVLHSYTLVHDDLPCMDDDALRRGQPTTHVVFGEALALLAGDALLTLAFAWMATCVAPDPWVPGQLSLELAQFTGSRGTIGGQVEDMAAEAGALEPTRERLDWIHVHKTAALLEVAARAGAMVGGGSEAQVDALGAYARALGLAFQVVDDLLDVEGCTDALGKPAGSDEARGKLTYPALHGVEASRRMAQGMLGQALQHLDQGGVDSAELEALARYVVQREH